MIFRLLVFFVFGYVAKKKKWAKTIYVNPNAVVSAMLTQSSDQYGVTIILNDESKQDMSFKIESREEGERLIEYIYQKKNKLIWGK